MITTDWFGGHHRVNSAPSRQNCCINLRAHRNFRRLPGKRTRELQLRAHADFYLTQFYLTTAISQYDRVVQGAGRKPRQMCDGEMAVNGNLIPSWIDGRSIGSRRLRRLPEMTRAARRNDYWLPTTGSWSATGRRRSAHGSGRWSWALYARSVPVAAADDGSCLTRGSPSAALVWGCQSASGPGTARGSRMARPAA